MDAVRFALASSQRLKIAGLILGQLVRFLAFLAFFGFLSHDSSVLLLQHIKSPYHIKLYSDILPASLNVQLRQHYFTRGKAKKCWIDKLSIITARIRPPKPLTRATIKIERVCSRYMDFDGLVGAFKSVVDAVVICGVLQDDSYDVTGPWIVTQKKGEPGFFMEITEVIP